MSEINSTSVVVDNYTNHSNGRIWIVWNDDMVDLIVLSSSNQHIHYGIFDTNGKFRHWLSVVYAHNHLEFKMRLCKNLESIHRSQ